MALHNIWNRKFKISQMQEIYLEQIFTKFSWQALIQFLNFMNVYFFSLDIKINSLLLRVIYLTAASLA